MGIFSKFENRMEDTVEGAASRMSKAPISPVQIAKKAEKQMRRETLVGAGKQYAPTLYTVLVNPEDDERLFGYYPTLAGETETYLSAKAAQEGLVMDGDPLVRFIVDAGLRHGKFDVVAELVAAPIIVQLRDEEMERYGLAPKSHHVGYDDQGQQAPEQVHHSKPPLPYVPEDEIDRSIDYGEYTFNSEDFEDYRNTSEDPDAAPLAYNDSYDAWDEGAQNDRGFNGEPAEASGNPVPEQPQQAQIANTVAFAGGAGANAVPDQRAVRARLVDCTYQKPYDLAGTRVTIGRETGNDIRVQDVNASRRHAELALNSQGLWVITDLKSMNGTFVNGVSVASQPLYPGDIVTIGKSDFEFALV